MRPGLLSRAVHELQRTGIIFAVDRSTGAQRELTIDEYILGIGWAWGGDIICLGRAIADATTKGICERVANTN